MSEFIPRGYDQRARDAYTAAFRHGMLAACNDIARDTANRLARRMSVREGDAFLAGYYAEKRKRT
jgi:hypothetical protein